MKIKKLLVLVGSAFPRWKNDTESYHIFLLNNELAKKRYSVTVLAPHHAGAKGVETLGHLRVYRFKYFWPPSMQKLCYNGGMLLNLKRYFLAKVQLPLFFLAEIVATLRIARREKADFIQANWLIPHGIVALIAKKMLGIRYGVSAHAADIFPMKSSFLRLLIKIILKNSDLCVANSTYTKNFLLNIHRTDKIRVIPIGIDTSYYKKDKAAVTRVRKKFSLPEKYIMYLGRFVEKKGLPYLIRAMPKVLELHPELVLVMVGGGPDFDSVKALILEMGLEKSIRLLGRLPNEDIVPLYAGATLFVGPSIIDSKGDTEGLGVVFLESLACGTPAIGTDVGGIPDIIKHRKTGLLVPQKDPEKLADAIIELLSDNKLRSRLARYGQEFVRKNFEWNIVAKKFDEAYRKLT